MRTAKSLLAIGAALLLVAIGRSEDLTLNEKLVVYGMILMTVGGLLWLALREGIFGDDK